jgi:hypothetical protein
MLRLVQAPLEFSTEFIHQKIIISPCKLYSLIMGGKSVILLKGIEQVWKIQSSPTIAAWSSDSKLIVFCNEKLELYSLDGVLVSSLSLHHSTELVNVVFLDHDTLAVIYSDCVVCLYQYPKQVLVPLSTVSFKGIYNSISAAISISDTLVLIGRDSVKCIGYKWKFLNDSPYFSNYMNTELQFPTIYKSSIHDHLYHTISHLLGYTGSGVKTACTWNHDGTKCLLLTSKRLELYVLENSLELMKSWMIEELIPLQLDFENESLIYANFWMMDTICLVTTHGRIAFTDLMNIKPHQLNYEILPLSFPFVLDCAPNDKIVFLQNNQPHPLFILIKLTDKEWINILIDETRISDAINYSNETSLHSDFVYKELWQRKCLLKMVDTSILSKISDKKWVLDQILCIPFDTTSAIRAVLEFGLDITNKISKNDMDQEIERFLEEECISAPQESNWPTVIDLFLYRIKIIKLLDRLSTFENIFQSEILLNSDFDVAKRFKDFSLVDLKYFVCDLACKGEVKKLETFFTRHGSEILPLQLKILDLIPCTIPCIEYKKLLPEVENGNVLQWKQIPWNRKDWSNSPNMLEFAKLLQDENPINGNEYQEKEENVYNWYQKKIQALEKDWDLVSSASMLCNFAVEKGIERLKETSVRLQTLQQIRSQCEGFEDATWEHIKSLHPQELIPVLLQSMNNLNNQALSHIFSTVEMLGIFRRDFIPYLENFAQKTQSWIPIFVKEISLDDDLKSLMNLENFISNLAFMDIENQDIKLWRSIVTILLQKNSTIGDVPREGWEVDDIDDIDNEDATVQVTDFQKELQAYVTIAEIFIKHNNQVNLFNVRKMSKEGNIKHVVSFLQKSSLVKEVDEDSWMSTLVDLLVLFDLKIFGSLLKSQVYGEFIFFALSKSRFQLVQKLLYSSKETMCLTSDQMEDIVLNAAFEFFDNDPLGDKRKGLLKNSMTW